MQSLLKTSVSVFLCVLMLAAGSGLSLAKMICAKSGHVAISLSVPDGCCKHEAEQSASAFKEKCCDVSTMQIEKLQYINAASHNIEKSVDFIQLPSLDFGVTAYTDVVSVKFREHAVQKKLCSPPVRIFTKSFLI